MNTISCANCENLNSPGSKYCSSCGFALPKKNENIEVLASAQKFHDKKNKKNVMGIIVGVITFFIFFYGAQRLFSVPAYDSAMAEMASEINKTCPVMVDELTRLDNVIALPKNIIQYNYTLISMDREAVNVSEMQHYLEPFLTNMIKTNPDMKFQREHKTTLNYYYKDKNGNYLFKISITPSKYL